MDHKTLSVWIEAHTAAEQELLAATCCTSVAYLKQLARGLRRPSESLAEAIHLATRGEVSAITFFPKLQRLSSCSEAIITTSSAKC